jgi:hypothetical protein
MPIRYTKTMLQVMTRDLNQRLARSILEFPELTDRTVTVGLTKRAEGTAEAEHMRIRLRVRRRRPVSYFTIGHELTHLLQTGGLGVVPSGEVQCDVWALARSELFLDDAPSYLCRHLWSRVSWPAHARDIRALCLQAIERRKTSRCYLMWLRDRIERHVITPKLVEEGMSHGAGSRPMK